MGRVYRATQTSVDRVVAVKTLGPRTSGSELVTRRFEREARVISEFSHPNIVQLFEFGEDEATRTLYLAMEYIDGHHLSRLLGCGRLDAELAVELALQLCGALAEVHSHGVVHRDLKPSNVMIVPLADGRLELKLLDFGIAHELQTSEELTETGSVWGTPHYLAPEQAVGRSVGPRTDIYSLGIILFRMLTGRAPVDGETPIEIMYKHTLGQVPKLEEVPGPDAECRRLARLVDWMLATDPEQRPSDVLEVREELSRIVDGRDWGSCRVDPSAGRGEMFEPYLKEACECIPAGESTLTGRPELGVAGTGGGESPAFAAPGSATGGDSSPPEEVSRGAAASTAVSFPGFAQAEPGEETPAESSAENLPDGSDFEGLVGRTERPFSALVLLVCTVGVLAGSSLFFGGGGGGAEGSLGEQVSGASEGANRGEGRRPVSTPESVERRGEEAAAAPVGASRGRSEAPTGQSISGRPASPGTAPAVGDDAQSSAERRSPLSEKPEADREPTRDREASGGASQSADGPEDSFEPRLYPVE